MGARLPSLLGATAAVLLTAWIGNLLFGAPAGFVAAVLLAASVLLGVEARMANIDAVLLATAGAQAGLARIYLSAAAGRIPRAGPLLLVVGARRRPDAEGADHPAGRVGTVLLLASPSAAAAWLRQLRPGWGLPLMLAVVLPWLIAIGIASGGAFFEIAIGKACSARSRPASNRTARRRDTTSPLSR